MNVNENFKSVQAGCVIKKISRPPKFIFKGVKPSLEERSISYAIERWREILKLSKN